MKLQNIIATEVLFVKVFREFSENLKRPHQKGLSKAEWFSIVAAPLISVWLYKLAIKTAQTVYNHTDYARSYHENNSIHEESPAGSIYYLSFEVNKYKLNPDS